MKKIIFIKSDMHDNVRLQKFFLFCKAQNFDYEFWGWNRTKRILPDNDNEDNIKYILNCNTGSTIFLPFQYILWMLVLFFRLFILRHKQQYNLMAINFESALPCFLMSLFFKMDYLYEIRDEIALSYHFPKIIRRIILWLDHRIMHRAFRVIHVDANRITYKDCKWVIIENSPYDFFEGKERTYENLKLRFAVVGYLTTMRGIKQIYQFAYDNPDIDFLVAGKFEDSDIRDSFQNLSNVLYYERMPQKELFELEQNCCAVFSLYDVSLEINRLAASNKVYDAMMLGIPVITNPDVINSSQIKARGTGFFVNYNYDETWDVLRSPDFLKVAIEKGKLGRKIYLKEYQFDLLLKRHFLSILK